MRYAELFCQSNFSFLTGASHPEELAIHADFLHYDALALTDECSVAGVVRAHSAIKQHQLNIKLIVGSFFRFQDDVHLILLCPTRAAYAELCRVITQARRRCDKGQYALSEWDLMSLKQCLVIWLPQQHATDTQWGHWLHKYHAERLWIGVQRHLNAKEQQYIEHCEQLARQFTIPITACGGVLMHTPSRLPLQHVLTAIRLGCTIERACSHLLTNGERALRSKVKLAKLYKPSWIKTATDIAERCQFDLDSLRYEYPRELVPKGLTPMAHLRQLVAKGKQCRFPTGVPDDIERIIQKELTLIEALDYPYYFLTIHDLVMFAKQQHILYQGRGSAANSVVCHCLEITSVDPRKISVLFERFISKERDEPPDIDVDFEHERREEVIQYLYQKYGRHRAALTATVITYRFKSAVRDVGKALGIDESQLNFFINNINRRDRAQDWQTQLVQLGVAPESLKGQHLIGLVNEILGFPHHLSQHVGGFVISAGPLYELVPVENAAMAERTVIQWDKDDLERLGLLKVDVLALGMLSAIRKCFALIHQHYGKTYTIAEINRHQDDPQVYAMIQKADTIGVFQIESRAQMNMLPRLKPQTYYDLVIQIAIVRPGPIQGDMVHPFLKRRNGLEAIDYPSEEVRQVLERTMGVPIFQEQVIKLAMVAAGFTGGEADQLRRAMASWKKNGDLIKFREKLINGLRAHGYSQTFADNLFEQICGFGEYGFPESHSASFALLAYVSAWLKYYYPECFYTALLNSMPMGFYSSSQIIQDAKRHRITILPVCINHSYYDHQVVRLKSGLGLRLGLRQIKGFSQQGVTTLLTHRPNRGYRQLAELQHSGLSNRDLQALASANAMAELSQDRYNTRWQLMDTLHELPMFYQHTTSVEQIHKLSSPSAMDSLMEDYAALGLSLEHHPIQLLLDAGQLGTFTSANELQLRPHRSVVTIVGVVTGRQAPGTAAGVTFFTLEDHTGNTNVIVWQATAREQKHPYLTAKILMVKGILEKEGQVMHVIAGRLIDLTAKLHQLKSTSRDFH